MTPVVAAAASTPATAATHRHAATTLPHTPPPAPHETGIATRLTRAAGNMALAETMPTGVRLIGGRPLPPDVLRNRLSQEQQAAITTFIAQYEKSGIAMQATFVASHAGRGARQVAHAADPLAPLLGNELFKETQALIARIGELPAVCAAAAAGGPAGVARRPWSPRIASGCAPSRVPSRRRWPRVTCCDSR